MSILYTAELKMWPRERIERRNREHIPDLNYNIVAIVVEGGEKRASGFSSMKGSLCRIHLTGSGHEA